MESQSTTSTQALKGNANPTAANVKEELTTYDLKAHSLLCAELLNGEGVDRLSGETDADLASRLWAS